MFGLGMSQQFSLQNNHLAHLYNHQSESYLKLGVYTPLCEMAVLMGGKGHDLVLTKQGSYIRNHPFCLLFKMHI